MKTCGGTIKGKTALYCGALGVTRQGGYWYLRHRDTPWKHESLAERMRGILAEDECNDTYGRCRMRQALMLIIYWNNRRICSANSGLPPMVKRQQYYESLEQAA